jgi:hypothetical protein
MAFESWFGLANTLALAGWLMLAGALFAGGGLRARLLALAGRLWPLALAGGYGAALAAAWGTAPAGSGFGTLQAVATLFSAPGALLAGWVHYLAFDLFVGRWIVDDALARGTHRLLLLPVLALTFMFGPLGLLAWFGLRALTGAAHSRQVHHVR